MSNPFSRRDFLKAGALLAGAASLPTILPAKPASAVRLTLLHTNDVHSHLDPMTRGTHAGLGGAAARSAFITRMRAENPNTLLLDAGDILQGTPYFNLYGGEAEFLAMNHVKYDAGTIGNHEFDNGAEHLAMLIRDHARFPFVNCNYQVDGSPLEGLTRDYITVEKEGLKIGILGIGIRLAGLVPESAFTGVRYQNPVEKAREVARHLRNEEDCDFIICLSHINLDAASERSGAVREPGDRDVISGVPEIDVVIGGHNHFFMQYPEVRWRRGNPPGYISQAGWGGTHIGVLQFDLYGRGRRELTSAGLGAATAATV